MIQTETARYLALQGKPASAASWRPELVAQISVFLVISVVAEHHPLGKCRLLPGCTSLLSLIFRKKLCPNPLSAVLLSGYQTQGFHIQPPRYASIDPDSQLLIQNLRPIRLPHFHLDDPLARVTRTL